MTAEEDALFGLPYVPPDATVPYGPHPSQVVDLHLPAGPAAGVRVTLLHGGFWREAYDRRHLAPLAAALAAQGVEVALAEYRRVGPGGGGGWPRTYEDVVRAAAINRRDQQDHQDRHVLVGHSAGGHLALCAASEDAVADAVVAIAPVADLARARELGLSRGAVEEFLGGERPADADPVLRPPARVPVTVLHGTDDPDVPLELSRSYVTSATAAGADVTLHTLPGTGHYAAVTPGTAAYGALLTALLSPSRGDARPT
ncbi:alpha/beta fold hydrolase [Streptomyces sp. NRRL B-1677]|uniref:alpha/beta hydrolase n=1 Tax=Streptomyces sp. NRRL B-1677 TaxID=2682966 RepID=UPI001892BEF2|nr:alpha/beta hydrolase [Streptomyces sp. NRRL B-1677]MBF6047779.1 alpha/beta fold hydrolase [Streptomyces sp. NRRL B-1677]